MSAAAQRLATPAVDAFRAQFPCFASAAWDGLRYLDSAATTQKPQSVIDAVRHAMETFTAPVHRGLYPLAEQVSEAYEAARATMAHFVGAAHDDEAVFVPSATAGINLVAEGWLRPRLRAGDEICVTRMEHHANLLPWQRVAQACGARLRVVGFDGEGRLDLDAARRYIHARTRLVAVVHVSNVLGTINPVAEIGALAHAAGAALLVDATQSAAHLPLDVQAMGADFLALSAHKMYGPAGIGLLWGRRDRLAEMEPLLVGGGMVEEAGFAAASRWRAPPQRFEAGSPDLPGVLGMAAAAGFVTHWRRTDPARMDGTPLRRHLLDGLRAVRGLRLHGPSGADGRLGIFSFQLDGLHPHDVAAACGDRGVCLRAGHHCCQPLHDWLGEPGSVRASLAAYSTREDVDALVDALEYARGALR
ncbi:aminotransferase class V-fold PLP-dependent enzyme [Sinimarinibacterium flocculans]|uniref:Probable cysteine desulfurase n=1 Tax=Sinimarinibacterium flocculans TaxID=985250 RepID=A0A318E3L0_9GAMM|nr:aminotransferase class V-fold PLP-dependent enzyme [Sinimarinibacterium flocculans]PXV65712.1 cysteine desulfurase/selenocysteine lyase [Sinimarinibacterium flocculans]